MTVWFDVEDLIRFFQYAKRPTGIQRLSFEVCAAAHRLAEPGGVGFCRRNDAGTRLLEVDFAGFEAAIRAAAEALPPAQQIIAAPPPLPPLSRTRIFAAARRLPPHYREPLGDLYRASVNAARALRALLRAAWRRTRPRRAAAGPIPAAIPAAASGVVVNPASGDWLIHLGASWERPYAPGFLNYLAGNGVRLGLFAHDMIPDLFPEWCTRSMGVDFSLWLDETVPRAERVFAISRHTLKDLEFCLTRRNRRVPDVTQLPPGGQGRSAVPPQPRPLAQPFVLMVGTIEARKNHGGMLRVWRHLLNAPPAGEVPVLVFAGKAGWLTSDLMQQLENAAYLGGKILFIDQPTETQLAALYQHCLFTLYPSLYEGWGLPVTESLCFGKPVIASNSSAIPEAGGPYCAYFDPDDLTEAEAAIRRWIEQPELVRAAAARIAAEFEPPRWEDTAAALLRDCAMPARE